MSLFNSPTHFGWVSRALHWTVAILVIFMLGLGTYIAQMTPSLDTIWLYGLHKSIGVCILILVLTRLIWNRISPTPPGLEIGVPKWQVKTAAYMRVVLVLLLFAVQLSGLIGSSATGIEFRFFNQVTVPPIAPVSEFWDTWAFRAHDILTKLLMICLVAHVGGALIHHFVYRDDTLKRMFR